MECKDYKEAIAADPAGSFDGSTHADACASCTAFREELRALDLKIARALALPLPQLAMPELPAVGDDTSNVVSLPLMGRGRYAVPVWIALAASVAFATVLGIRFLTEPTIYPSLGAEILAHLDHEPRSLQVTDVAVSGQKLASVLEEDVAGFDTGIGLVTYARTCVINGHKVPHLVIQGEQGPITLLLLPDETIESAVPLEGRGTVGVILPVGDGSIAIIGERGEHLEEIEERLADSVKWSI